MTAAGGTRRLEASLAGGALVVAGITAVARVVGFGRWFVFSKTVGDGCLGDAYNTANQLPNVLFEVAAGGALAGVVVPLLAGAVARGDHREASRTCSALLGWSFVVLVPLAALAAVLAPVYSRILIGEDSDCGPSSVDLAARMLLVFIPQVLFYAVAVVLSGTLQAHRRFVAPALAPLVSSVVVIAAYVGFALLADGDLGPATSSRGAVAVLAGGTTLGVLALALTVLVPLPSTGVRLRPTLRFPPGVAPRARALASAGIAVLTAQQLTAVLVTWLANHRGDEGSLTRYTYALALFALPYAVLAVPIATSAYPRVAAEVDAGADEAADATIAVSTRAVLLAGCVGAALLAGSAVPVARAFVLGPAGSGDADPLARGLVGLAAGLVGYGLVFQVGRVLYACRAARAAALATVVGWMVVAVAAVALTAAVDPDDAVLALGLATSAGMTVAGAALLVALARVRGRGALAGLGRAGAAGVVAAAVGAAAGLATGRAFREAGLAAAIGGSVLAAAASVLAAGVVLVLLDRPDVVGLRTALRRLGSRS